MFDTVSLSVRHNLNPVRNPDDEALNTPQNTLQPR